MEKHEVGASWRRQRWDNFCLNTPNWTLNLPGRDYAGGNPDGFMDRADSPTLERIPDLLAELYELNCVSCHGADGEGGIGPALNSQEFLTAADDTQTKALISIGIPGSLMSAYALDFGGPLTAQEIDGLATYLRSWEEDAPENPDWRACCG